MSTRFARKVSALERYFLAINEVYRFNAELVVEGEGEISLEQLQAAVAQASAANPGMRVRLRGVMGLSRWVDSGLTPEVREISAAEWEGYSSQGAEFLEERFRPLQGGQVAHVLLVRGDAAQGRPARMVFRALHAAVDGKGLAHWTLDILRAMRGDALEGSHNTMTDIAFARSVARSKGIVPQPSAPGAPMKSILPLSPDNGSPFRFEWRCTKFDRNISNPMPKILHFLKGQAEGDILMTVPVDYRSLRGAEAGTGNLTGYIHIPINGEDSPKSIMGKLSEGIKNHRDCSIGVLPFWRLHWIPLWLISRFVRKNLDQILYSENSSMPNGGISALGMTPEEDISFPGFRGMGAYGLATVGRLYVSVTNFPKATYIMLAAPARFNGDKQLDKLAERLREQFA